VTPIVIGLSPIKEINVMKKSIIAALMLSLSAIPSVQAEEGLYLELGATAYLKGLWGGSRWEGDNPGARIDLFYQWDNQPWYLPDKIGYFHQSNWFNGKPFNDEFEDHLDYIYASKVINITDLFK
jgi:hypothetical protein